MRRFLATSMALALMPAPLSSEDGPSGYSLFFDWGKNEVRRDDVPVLDRIAGEWRERPTARILVSGHADRSGTPAANHVAGLRRAMLVRSELEKRGVARNVIRLVSFGEQWPLVPTEDGVREVQNRRVVITFEE